MELLPPPSPADPRLVLQLPQPGPRPSSKCETLDHPPPSPSTIRVDEESDGPPSPIRHRHLKQQDDALRIHIVPDELPLHIDTCCSTSHPPSPCSGSSSSSSGAWHAAHTVITAIATPAAFAPLPSAFSWLGWLGGISCLLLFSAVSCYNSHLMAQLCGGSDSYSQLSKEAFGTMGQRIANLLRFFQQLALIGSNVALLLAAASAMQAIDKLLNPDTGRMNLQQFIAIFAGLQLLLSQLPNIYILFHLNHICSCATIGFTIAVTGLAVYNGRIWREAAVDASSSSSSSLSPTPSGPGPVDFSISGSASDIACGVSNSLGTMAFAFGNAIMPEIQAQASSPRQAEPSAHRTSHSTTLAAAYLFILTNYLAVAVSGYWATGFSASSNAWLPSLFSAPVWAVIAANVFAITQIAGCFQLYCRPTYLVLDHWLPYSRHLQNLPGISPRARRLYEAAVRVCITTAHAFVLVLMAAAFPFLGDFVALVGSVGFIPLDFVLPLLLYNKVKAPPRGLQVVHYMLAAVFALISAAGFAGALRWIQLQLNSYHVFAS